MKTERQVTKGEVYVSPQWEVACASCGTCIIVADHKADTVEEAEKFFRSEGTDGWAKYKGLWYCDQHIGDQYRPKPKAAKAKPDK